MSYPLCNRKSYADPGFRGELFLDNFTADEVVKKVVSAAHDFSAAAKRIQAAIGGRGLRWSEVCRRCDIASFSLMNVIMKRTQFLR
jgi:hypothetical protein